jgi:hypothetical protein
MAKLRLWLLVCVLVSSAMFAQTGPTVTAGAKGSTASATVTSEPVDANTQALHVFLKNTFPLDVEGGDANNTASTMKPLQLAGYSWTDGTAPTATTAGNVTRLLTTRDGRLVVTTDHPKRFQCNAVNLSATTLTALGGSCAAPGAGLSLYITDINASASAASTTTADQFLELKSGTGGTCGTGTAVVWASYNTAFGGAIAQFITPLKVTANNELCWMDAVTGSKTFIVSGYIAP